MPISSVVLSGQEVSLKDAIYNATKGKDAARNDAANPLVQDEMKLIPSVSRIFSLDRDFYVYLQAYLGSVPTAVTNVTASAPLPITPAAAPLVASVSFYQERKKVMEAPGVVAIIVPGTRLGVEPLRFKIGLGGLAPRRYECLVSVLDPNERRAAFWVGQILLVRDQR